MMLQESRYEEYLSYLYELADRQYGNCAESDTLIQDTMLALLVKEQRGEAIDHPKGFLSAVMRNKYNDWLRRRYRDRVISCELTDRIPADDPTEDLPEDHEALRREIGRLIAIYREVTVRHYLHGHSVEKIATDLHIPRGTVLSRLSSARRQLKGRLQTMKTYSEYSYEPKDVRLGIWGSTGINNEPFSLVSSLIESNLLILAYDRPVSVKALADALGMPCAYLEPIIDKLVAGELMGKTSGGLLYTRCFMLPYEKSFGDIAAQEALADARANDVSDVLQRHLAPLMMHEEVTAMTDKQKATLLLYFLQTALTTAVTRAEPTADVIELPERPNGGRWLLTATVIQPQGAHALPYDRSGPFIYHLRAPAHCYISDLQSCFGDTHWRYHCLPYRFPIGEILKFLASFYDPAFKPSDERLYELIPALEELHILRRGEDGTAKADFPALSFEEHDTHWQSVIADMTDEITALLKDDLAALWQTAPHRIPSHVDHAEQFTHHGALGAYVIAQMRSIVNKGLLPYPVTVGETPILFMLYQK